MIEGAPSFLHGFERSVATLFLLDCRPCSSMHILFFFFFLIVFLGPHLWHIEVPSLWPTPQLTATPDPQPTKQGQGSNPHPHGS